MALGLPRFAWVDFLITTPCPGGLGRRRLFLALLGVLCVMSVCRGLSLVKALLSYNKLRLYKLDFTKGGRLVFLHVESHDVL